MVKELRVEHIMAYDRRIPPRHYTRLLIVSKIECCHLGDCPLFLKLDDVVASSLHYRGARRLQRLYVRLSDNDNTRNGYKYALIPFPEVGFLKMYTDFAGFGFLRFD